MTVDLDVLAPDEQAAVIDLAQLLASRPTAARTSSARPAWLHDFGDFLEQLHEIVFSDGLLAGDAPTPLTRHRR